MVENHYRWDFIGLSTDDKPTPATSEKVADGSTFYCSDNSKLYVFYKDQWYEKEATGGGGTTYEDFVGTDGEEAGTHGLVPAPATTDAGKYLKADGTWAEVASGGDVVELTSANYNYHKTGDTDDSIAPWLLNQGLYLVKAGTKMWFHKNQLGSASTFTDDVFMIIGATSGYATSFIMVLPGANLYGGSWRFGDGTLDTVTGAGSGSNGLGLVRGTQIIDNLNSSTSDMVLSAKQGKVLNDKIGDLSSLNTTDKTSIVAAINEILTRL